MDVKDIMGVSRGAGAPAEKADKPKERKMIKPKGMSREAFALLSGSHPLTPSQLAGDIRKASGLNAVREKARRSSKGWVSFQWMPFTNPARTDGLQLEHWVKCYKDATGKPTPASNEPYMFAKFNKKTPILRYNDEEWDSLVTQEPGWDREETDHLLDVCQQFDLRWLVIADRYEWKGDASRSMEDLKARYYSVSHSLLVGRAGGKEPVANHPLVRHPYNKQHEMERKKGLELSLERTKEQEAREDEVLREAAAILQARQAEEAARRAAAGQGAGTTPDDGVAGAGAGGDGVTPTPVSQYDNEPEPDVPPMFAEGGVPTAPVNRVFVRGAACKELAESVVAKLQPTKVQKALEGSLAELKVTEFPRVPTRSACGAYLALQAEVLTLLELKRQLATRQALSAGTKRPAVKLEQGDEATPRADKRQRVARRFADD